MQGDCEACLKSREQKRGLNTQESTAGGDQLESDTQESSDSVDAQAKHKSPPHPKKKSKKNIRKCVPRNTKSGGLKKGELLRNGLCVVNLLIHSWSLICTLSRSTNINPCTAVGNVAKHLVA